VRSLLIAISSLLLLAAPAQASTYRVTSGADPAAGPGTCAPVTDGIFDCQTLRAAVLAANTAAGGDSIVLAAGTYDVGEGELAVSGQVSITGGGPRDTTIRRVGATSSRLFNFGAGSGGSLITFLTLSGGQAQTGNGGNVLTAGDLLLAYVHVTAGNASGGGGIAITGPGSLQISSSLLDGNDAGTGGAIFALNADLAVVNSTITANSAEGIAGVFFSGAAGNTATLAQTTVGRNSRALQHAGSGTFELQGTIVSDNAQNCAGTFTDGGGNIEDKNECGFGAGSVHGSSPGLAGSVENLGGLTDVLSIPAGSPAVDIVSPCVAPIDQRDFARVTTIFQACDAGAYEATPNSGPITPQQTPTPTPTATPSPTPTPTPGAIAAPVPQKSASGTGLGVKVKAPGGKYVALDPSRPIPDGSEIDTTAGRITLIVQLKKGGPLERATFSDGIFKLGLGAKTTDLTLIQPLAKCPKKSGQAAAKKPKTRKLWGDGSGHFRTRGQYSAATIRGTRYLVQDSCAGTLTRVLKGVVSVRDNVKRKTIVLRAGKSYLAKPRR
jgi:hypothetical protein